MAKMVFENRPSLAVIEVKWICLGWVYPVKVSSQRATNGIYFIPGIFGAIAYLQFPINCKNDKKIKHYCQDILQKSPPSRVNLSNFIHMSG
jgi:hypothetical protein